MPAATVPRSRPFLVPCLLAMPDACETADSTDGFGVQMRTSEIAKQEAWLGESLLRPLQQ